MEIRGLGIINIKDLFGISAVRDAKKIELVVELVEWNEEEEYDRLGVEELRHSILDVAVPMLRVPIRPGRNITTIIEVAARNQLLKFQGKHSAREFQERLNRALIEAEPDVAAPCASTRSSRWRAKPMRIVIVTGVSGAGKSTALRALEDAGFFCVDNLPLPLLDRVRRAAARRRRARPIAGGAGGRRARGRLPAGVPRGVRGAARGGASARGAVPRRRRRRAGAPLLRDAPPPSAVGRRSARGHRAASARSCAPLREEARRSSTPATSTCTS